ncbi:MAG: UvrD-helicase domain-containing protein [Candidatus Woesearchaeota archaeon]
MQFNADGSLKVTRVKRDHITVFNLIDELDFPVGKKLLVQLLRGEESLRIKRLGLEKKVYHGSLGGYDESDLLKFVEHLIKNGFLAVSKFRGTMPVIELTAKGSAEMDERGFEMSVDDILAASPSSSPDGLSSSPASSALEFPSFEPAVLTDHERRVCEGLSFFFERFTDEQQKAIVDMSSRQACVAGAGSGKTSVLTHKIAYLVRFAGVPPGDILAITFTRKARREMSSRLHDLLGEQAEWVRIETFNSFAEKELLRHGLELYGLHKVMIPNRDFIRLVSRAIHDSGFETKTFLEHYFTARERRGKEERELFFSFLYDFHSILEEYDAVGGDTSLFDKRIAEAKLSDRVTATNLIKIVKTVSSELDERGFRTYSDQVPDTLRLFKNYPEHKPFFPWVLVDEYQDVSPTQQELVDLLSPDYLFVVGDPRQSIFAWRGADPGVMLHFMKSCASNDGAIMELSTNFRSSPEILSFANDLIAAAHGGKNPYHSLKPSRTIPGRVSVDTYTSEDDEARAVVDYIVHSSVARNSIFVLSRTNRGLEKVKKHCQEKGVRFMLRTDEQAKASEDPDPDQVTLSTVHAIKGLEAEVVFVIGATSLNYPCKAKDHRFVRILCSPLEYDQYEEERRLFYVACTRAKKELYVSYASSPSPFLSSGSDVSSGTSVSHQGISSDRLEKQKKALKRWRFLEAKDRGVPAYVIFSNKVLDQLLDRQPSTVSELYGISGLGASKIEEFGMDIVHILQSN